MHKRGKNIPYGNGKGQYWARYEKRKRHLGRTGYIKKVQNHEYYVSEEIREKMDVEKPKLCNKDRN